MRRIRSIRDVAERHLCSGCGACAAVQPDDIHMVDDLTAGRRPVVADGADGRPRPTGLALSACPGVHLEHAEFPNDTVASMEQAWGPILEVWEGHAGDDEIRLAGSSGGAATALALHCLSVEGMHGVLHTVARTDVPYLNTTALSTSREQLVAATGSRYAPASPCEGLGEVRDAPSPCVFIGKPCDIAGASRARALDAELDSKIGLTIAIFCAGTPSTKGTLEMLESMGIDDPTTLQSVRYRGNGWPGDAVAVVDSEDGPQERRLSYAESWGDVLQRHRQWRCYICPDHTGEFADIAVGDPWYRELAGDEPGSSLIVARTENGRRIIRAAIESGALSLTPVDPSLVAASQPNLLEVRGSVWGRTTMMRIAGLPAPVLRGLPTFPVWWRSLSRKQRLQSIIGTAKRIVTKRLYRRRTVIPLDDPRTTTPQKDFDTCVE